MVLSAALSLVLSVVLSAVLSLVLTAVLSVVNGPVAVREERVLRWVNCLYWCSLDHHPGLSGHFHSWMDVSVQHCSHLTEAENKPAPEV